MFYLPFDIGYKVFKFLPVKVACAAMKEVYRAKKVNSCSEKHGESNEPFRSFSQQTKLINRIQIQRIFPIQSA